jgi:beta-N-acetylhexosaminidase
MLKRRSLLESALAGSLFASASPTLATEEGELEVGQLMLTGFRGRVVSEEEVDALRRHIERGDVAGVIIQERNVRSPEQLERLIHALQNSALNPPLIVAVDQEGGEVARLRDRNGFLSWMSASELASSELSADEVLAYYSARAEELAEVGINLNLAPVVDLNTNPFNPIIGGKGRSFGRSVDQVLHFSELFVLGHRLAGVKTCLKHFPGHGSSTSDSHEGEADVSATWRPEEIAPFERMVRAGLADTLMNGHLRHQYLSDGGWMPTSLSVRSTEEIRDGLGFQGPIITDDMQMGAITDFVSAVDAGTRAIGAGNSLLVYSNYRDQYSIQTISDVNYALKGALATGELSSSRVARSLALVKRFRESLITSP